MIGSVDDCDRVMIVDVIGGETSTEEDEWVGVRVQPRDLGDGRTPAGALCERCTYNAYYRGRVSKMCLCFAL